MLTRGGPPDRQFSSASASGGIRSQRTSEVWHSVTNFPWPAWHAISNVQEPLSVNAHEPQELVWPPKMAPGQSQAPVWFGSECFDSQPHSNFSRILHGWPDLRIFITCSVFLSWWVAGWWVETGLGTLEVFLQLILSRWQERKNHFPLLVFVPVFTSSVW